MLDALAPPIKIKAPMIDNIQPKAAQQANPISL